jgi:hypothetical protein
VRAESRVGHRSYLVTDVASYIDIIMSLQLLRSAPNRRRGAGTDANVFIALYGAVGSIGQNRLETHGVRAVWGG